MSTNRFARLDGGIVAEILTLPSDVALGDALHPAIAAQCLPCGDDVGVGFVHAGGVFTAPAPEAAQPSRAELTAYAADRRWRQEVGGIVLAGIPVATDDRAKTMILGARMAAMADSGWTTVWHGTDGASYPLDAAAIVAISDAVQAHVNQGFATFASVKAAIEAGTVTTIDAIDAAFA